MYTGRMQDGDIPYGVGVLVAKDGGFLCGVRSDSGQVCGPGGFIKDGESPVEAAIRETKEEFGVTPKGLVKLGAIKNNKGLYAPAIVFLCIDYEGDLKCPDGEMSFPGFCSLDGFGDEEINKYPAFEDSLQLLKDMLDAQEEEAQPETEEVPKVEEEPEVEEKILEPLPEASENATPKRDPRLVSPMDKGQEKLKEKFGGSEEVVLTYEPVFPHDAELSYKNAIGDFMESMDEVIKTEFDKIAKAYENENPQERQDSMFGAFGDAVDKFVKAVATGAGLIITAKVIKKLRKIAEKIRRNSVDNWTGSIDEALDIEVDEEYYNEEYFAEMVDQWEQNNIEYVENTTGQMIDEMAGDFMEMFIAGVAVTALMGQVDRRKQKALRHLNFIAGDQVSKLDAAMHHLEMVDAMVSDYIWSTRKDDKVRPRHRELEGQRFSFDDPPVMDSGEKCNPGEDYNCRCVALPIFNVFNLLLPIKQMHDSYFPGELNAIVGEKDVKDGGPGSGNWGHAGRPGHEGGSASGGGKQFRLVKPDGGYTGMVWAYRANEAFNRGGKKALVTSLNEPEGTFSGKAEPPKTKAAKVETGSFPGALTKGKEKANTQILCDYINSRPDADPAVVALYGSLQQQMEIGSENLPFKVSHAKGSAFTVSYYLHSGKMVEMKLTTPKLDGVEDVGSINTALHEQMHMMDFLLRDDLSDHGGLSHKSAIGKKFSDVLSASKLKEVTPKCKDIIKEAQDNARKAAEDVAENFKQKKADLVKSYYPDGKITTAAIVADFDKYDQYKKEASKLDTQYEREANKAVRTAYNGIDNLSDIFDALSGGYLLTAGKVGSGHGMSYYSSMENRKSEILANFGALSVSRPDIIKVLAQEQPQLVGVLNELVGEMNKKLGGKT